MKYAAGILFLPPKYWNRNISLQHDSLVSCLQAMTIILEISVGKNLYYLAQEVDLAPQRLLKVFHQFQSLGRHIFSMFECLYTISQKKSAYMM